MRAGSTRLRRTHGTGYPCRAEFRTHIPARPMTFSSPTLDSFPNKQSRPKSVTTRLYARTALHPRAVTRGPRPCFEGAHRLRRCAPFSKGAHLGKARRFLRRCAPISKVRTENCAPSKGERCGPEQVSLATPRPCRGTSPGLPAGLPLPARTHPRKARRLHIDTIAFGQGKYHQISGFHECRVCC